MFKESEYEVYCEYKVNSDDELFLYPILFLHCISL